MIICKVYHKENVSQLSDSREKSFQFGSHKLKQHIEDLISCEYSFWQIELKLEFNQHLPHDIKKLLDIIANSNKILIWVSDVVGHNDCQSFLKECHQAYWQANKKFHTQFKQKQQGAKAFSLANFPLVLDALPVLSILSNRQRSLLPEAQINLDTEVLHALSPPTTKSEAVPLRNKYPIELGPFDAILNILKTDALKLEAYLGIDGLENLLSEFKKFDREDFTQLYQIFFSQGLYQEENRQVLVRPSGLRLLKTCLSWPKSLLKHFLSWSKASDAPNFEKYVQKNQELWNVIQDYNPNIPEFFCDEKIALHHRIDCMLTLLKRTDVAWKLFQIEAMFGLNWTEFERILGLKDAGCQFITQAMLADSLEVCAAKYLKDPGQYQDVKRFQELKTTDNEAFLEFLLSLPNFSLTLKYVDTLKQLFHRDMTSDEERKQFLENCTSIPFDKRFDASTLLKQWLVSKKEVIHLMDIYLQFLDKDAPKDSVLHWSRVVDLLTKNPESLEGLLELKLEHDYDCNYFQLICIPLVSNLTPQAPLLGLFLNLDLVKQKECLNILSTIQNAQTMTEDGLAEVLQEASDKNLAALFLEKYPQVKSEYLEQTRLYENKILDMSLAMIDRLYHALCRVTDDEHKISSLPYSYRSCLTSEYQAILEQKIPEMIHINEELLRLKGVKEFNFLEIFELMIPLDAFFKDLLNDNIGHILTPTIASTMYLLSGRLLTSKKPLKDLLIFIADNYTQVKPYIGAIFDEELLAKLKNTSQSTSIIDFYLDELLVKPCQEDRNIRLQEAQCSQIIKTRCDEILAFLVPPAFKLEELEEFYDRAKTIDKLIEQCAHYESEFTSSGFDVENIWAICIQYQSRRDRENRVQVSPPSYWSACFDWFNLITKHHHHLQNRPAFFLEQLLSHQDLYPKKLNLDGSIADAKWHRLNQQLEYIFENYSKHPAFLNLLGLCFREQLEHGRDLDIDKVGVFFEQIGEQNKNIIPSLVILLQSENLDIKQQAEVFFGFLSTIFQKPNVKVWMQFIKKILKDDVLNSEDIQNLNEILSWLDTSAFDWLPILVEDHEATLTDFIEFVRVNKNLSPKWCLNTELETKSCPLPKVPDKKPKTKSWFFQILSSFIYPSPYDSSDETDLHASDLSIEERLFVIQAWDIFQRPTYPAVKQLNKWLGAEPLYAREDILQFDIEPRHSQQEKAPEPELGWERWARELKRYDKTHSLSQINHLKERLEGVLEGMSMMAGQSRTDLLARLEELKQLYQQTHVDDVVVIENEILAILAELYRKVTTLRPYPVQLIFLLMNLEIKDQNLIAEVDTGEGKALSIALLAALKWMKHGHHKVVVMTAHPDLIEQDFMHKRHYHFFKLLGIPVDPKNSILLKDSTIDSFKPDGIYYTTPLNMSVFLNRFNQEQGEYAHFDVIIDEVDKAFFDQSFLLNLVMINPVTQDMDWIYGFLNAFVDTYVQESVTLSMAQWVLRCKNEVYAANQHSLVRLSKLNQISEAQWVDWLRAAMFAQNLRENKDFIIEKTYTERGYAYQIVPYVNGELCPGYEISYQNSSGVVQFLQARFHREDRPVLKTPQTKTLNKIEALNLRQVSSLVGLSGSIGDLGECLDFFEAIKPALIRIPRHHEKRLHQLPSLLVDNQRALNEKLYKICSKYEQPILIVCQEISEAEEIQSFLSNTLAPKTIRLITEKQSAEERSDWLYNKSLAQHAGMANCITVATKICGRGTDILTNHQHGLYVLQIGVLDARNKVQVLGRAARCGQIGRGVTIFDRKKLETQAKSYAIQLPRLTSVSLSQWERQIQKMMAFGLKKQQMTLRVKSWYENYLTRYLEWVFSQCAPDSIVDEQKTASRLWLFKKIEQHISNDLMHSFELDDIEGCMKDAIKVWMEMGAYLRLNGLGDLFKEFDERSFSEDLKQDIHHWRLMMDIYPQDQLMLEEQEKDEENDTASELSIDVPFSDGLQIHKDTLAPFIPLKAENNQWWLSLLYWFMALFNPTAIRMEQYLEDSWIIFKDEPTSKNLEHFYQTLLMAKGLYEKQSNEWFWRIDYWFGFTQVLRLWKHVMDMTNDVLFHDFSQTNKDEQWVKWVLTLPELTSNLNNPFVQWLFPLQSQLQCELMRSYDDFRARPSQSNYATLFENLLKAKDLLNKGEFYGFWRLDHWWFWRPWFLQWEEIQTRTLDWEKENTPHLSDWLQKQDKDSSFRLNFFGHLNCQEQLQNYDIRYPGQLLCQMSADFQKQADENPKLMIFEMGRFFTPELQGLYKKHVRPSENQIVSMNHLQKYLLVLDILKFIKAHPETMFAKPFLSLAIDLIPVDVRLINPRMVVLINELEKNADRGMLKCIA